MKRILVALGSVALSISMPLAQTASSATGKPAMKQEMKAPAPSSVAGPSKDASKFRDKDDMKRAQQDLPGKDTRKDLQKPAMK